MKEFNYNTFDKPLKSIPTLRLTIDTSKNKTFKITRLNKGTAPTDLLIEWGDGSTTTYDDLLASGVNNHLSHTYIDNKVYKIILSGSIKESIYSITFENNTNLISVNGNIFIYYSDSLTSANYLNRIFYGCANLTSISSNIFKLCTNIKNFINVLSGCTSLQYLPNGLFKYNDKVTNFQGSFVNSTSLKDLPEDLFRYNTLVVSFYYSFQYCSSLQNIPIGLLDTNINITNLEGCFDSCTSVTSIVPDLWNKTKWPKVNKASYCFRGCSKAANYASIPGSWR